MKTIVQISRTHDGQTVTGLNELVEIPVSHRRIQLLSASVAPTAANAVLHSRIGYSFKQSTGDDGSVDMAVGLARRYEPVVLPYARELQGPGELYAAILVEVTAVAQPFTFNVAYEVVQ